MTTTLHIENTVRDYDSWKAVFDKFERVRQDAGVQHVRLCRTGADGRTVHIELDFPGPEQASAFREVLQRIWSTPQSQAELAGHAVAEVRELVEDRPLTGVPVG